MLHLAASAELHVGIHVECTLSLFHFKQNWSVQTNCSNLLKYAFIETLIGLQDIGHEHTVARGEVKTCIFAKLRRDCNGNGD